MSGQFKDIAILVFGRGMQILAALATIKIATSLMSPDQVGSINQLTSLAVLLSSALIAPVSAYIGRGLLEWRDAGVLTERLFRFAGYVAVTSILLAFPVWYAEAAADFVSAVSPQWVSVLVLIYLVFFSIHTVATTGLVILGRRTTYAVFANVAPWAGLALAVVLLQGHARPEMWLLGIFSGFVVSSLGFFALLRSGRAGRELVGSGQTSSGFPFGFRSVFLFAFPQIIVYVLWWIQSQSYRFLLDDISGLASVGLFFAAYALCSMPMSTFETLFNEYYAPTLYRKIKGEDRVQLAKAWNAYASAYVPAVVLFGAFLAGAGPYLAKLLLGREFQEVGRIMIWPAMTEILRAVSSSLHTMGIVKVDMRLNIPPVVAGAVISPLLVYLLAPHDPLAGTGIALFTAGLAVLLLAIPISYRALPIRWPWRRIAQAAILGSPMIVAGALADFPATDDSWTYAFAALVVGVAYLSLAQYVLARKWLREVNSPVRVERP